MTAVTLDMMRLGAVVDSGPTALFATVSGAHLYGFASPDSDVDLRGVFVQRLEERLKLNPPDDTITIMRTEPDGLEMDWVAHDIHKFAMLMTKRNGYVLEQLYSPLVVRTGPLHEELKDIGRGCVVRHLYHHYRGFAANQRKILDAEAPTVKDLLYAYRVYLTGIHVLRSGEIEANLGILIGHYKHDGIRELIDRKTGGAEHGALELDEVASHTSRLDGLETDLGQAFEACRLPESPTTFDALSEFVARVAMELGRD